MTEDTTTTEFTQLVDELAPNTTILSIHNDEDGVYRRRCVKHFDEDRKMYKVTGTHNNKDQEFWVGMNWWHSYVRRASKSNLAKRVKA